MHLLRRILTVSTLMVALAPVASAGCTGYVVKTGCSRCGFLWLNKYGWKTVTYYHNNADGTCGTSTDQESTDCGGC